MIRSLKQTIMERDGLSESEVAEQIREAKERVWEGEDPEEILLQDFGLEPDYVFDLLD